MKVTGSWNLELDLSGASRKLAEGAVARIVERTFVEGRDATGGALAEYSPLYRLQLEAIGQPTTPALKRSGALMRDVKVMSADVSGAVLRIVIGVGDGTSMSLPRPPPWVFSQKQTPKQRASALERWRASSKTPKPSPPHSELAGDLAHADHGRRARDFLALTDEDVRSLVVMFEGVRFMKS